MEKIKVTVAKLNTKTDFSVKYYNFKVQLHDDDLTVHQMKTIA